MIDVVSHDGSEQDLWWLFEKRIDELGVRRPACVQASIDDREVPHTDTRDTRILETATMPEVVRDTAVTVKAALLYIVGFKVRSAASYWNRSAIFLATASGEPALS
jgi:hypothetical protein